jgi:hypothetical protein
MAVEGENNGSAHADAKGRLDPHVYEEVAQNVPGYGRPPVIMTIPGYAGYPPAVGYPGQGVVIERGRHPHPYGPPGAVLVPGQGVVVERGRHPHPYGPPAVIEVIPSNQGGLVAGPGIRGDAAVRAPQTASLPPDVDLATVVGVAANVSKTGNFGTDGSPDRVQAESLFRNRPPQDIGAVVNKINETIRGNSLGIVVMDASKSNPPFVGIAKGGAWLDRIDLK